MSKNLSRNIHPVVKNPDDQHPPGFNPIDYEVPRALDNSSLKLCIFLAVPKVVEAGIVKFSRPRQLLIGSYFGEYYFQQPGIARLRLLAKLFKTPVEDGVNILLRRLR